MGPNLRVAPELATAFWKILSMITLLCSTSTCIPYIQRLAACVSLSWNNSTDVAIPNNNTNGMRSFQGLKG